MSTLLDALELNCPEAGVWVRQAVGRLESTRLDDSPVHSVIMGRMGMAGVGEAALLETVLVLGADAMGLGQPTTGPPRCRWIPLDSVIEIEDRNQVDGVLMRVDVILESGVRLLLEAPASFIHDLLTALGSLQGVDVGLDDSDFEDEVFDDGEPEDSNRDGGDDDSARIDDQPSTSGSGAAAEASSVPVMAQMEGVTYSSRFETSGTAARAAARSWLKDDRRRGRTPNLPRTGTDGDTDTAGDRPVLEAGRPGLPEADAQADSVHTASEVWRWSADGEADTDGGDGWVDAPVVPVVPPPGYRGDLDDEPSQQWVERVAQFSSVADDRLPTSARTTFGTEEDDESRSGSETWQDPSIVWPQPLQGVTYLSGDPGHPKRRRGLFVVFSPAGIRAVAVGYSQFCIDVAWSSVRDVVVETPDELEERTGARVDSSSSGLVIVTDDASFVFEYRRHSPPATRSALASVLSLVARL